MAKTKHFLPSKYNLGLIIIKIVVVLIIKIYVGEVALNIQHKDTALGLFATVHVGNSLKILQLGPLVHLLCFP